MPQLGVFAPLAGAGAGGGTIAAGGTATVAGGLTAAELTVLGVAAATALTVTAIGVKDVIEDYLDDAEEAEIDSVLTQAGDRSRAEQSRLRDCEDCIWCLVNIQVQGSYVEPRRGRATSQGVGPYLVQGRTVYVREGIILAGASHEFAQDVASRSSFRDIVRWGILAKTIAYIQAQPPSGLAPGVRDAHPGNVRRYRSWIRYDILVSGTINAFMA